MSASVKSQVEEYLSDLASLYEEIRGWLRDRPLKIKQTNIEIHEEATGRYKAPKLIISSPGGQRIAEVVPVGAWIIGAQGRVDLIGLLDSQPIVYLSKGGPILNTTTSIEGIEVERKSKPFFRGIAHPGWYWIEEKRLGRAHLLTKRLFLELLSLVSDYAL